MYPRVNIQRSASRREYINIEPVLQSTGFKDGGKSVEQEEAISTSPDIKHGRSISSQVTAVNATAKKNYVVIRNQLIRENRMATITKYPNRFFDAGGKQRFLPQGKGLNVQEGLYCYSVLVWGMLPLRV